MMINGIDPLNHSLFRRKFLGMQDEAVPLLMSQLYKPSDDRFVELAVRILGRTRINVAKQLMDVILRQDKSVYQLSILCLLLGYFNHPQSVRFLWNHYCHFGLNYPDEKYWKGPFYGLWETWARGKKGGISTGV
jgi:hypothetical protein